MTNNLTATQQKRYNELYQEAVVRYLDKTDWDIYQWLDKKEVKEFKELNEILEKGGE